MGWRDAEDKQVARVRTTAIRFRFASKDARRDYAKRRY